MSRSGSCLCGKVTFTAEPLEILQACHCDMCRNWGGGPYMAVPSNNARFVGPVSTFSSSDYADRGFCSNCGTHLFFYAKKQDMHGIPIGLFDDQSGLPFTAEIFTDEKPDYYDFANDTAHITSEQYVKKFR